MCRKFQKIKVDTPKSLMTHKIRKRSEQNNANKLMQQKHDN